MKFFAIVYGSLLLIGSNGYTQHAYQFDRVYTGNQVSNTVSVIDPSTNKLLGEIKLGKPHPNALAPLYREESLVHGLGYCESKKMLAVVSIGSNSVSLISTTNNKVLKTIYLGRSPHEATFKPDGSQVWVTVRGEAYISVIDIDKMAETEQVKVSDGPGMVSFSRDGQLAFVCSSFTPTLDVVNTSSYQAVKKIPVLSPFSPNIFTSDDGKWVAMTHKDVGKVTIIDPQTLEVSKVLITGPLTNHVSFSRKNGRLLLSVTVGGENSVKVYDVDDDFGLKATIPVGVLPHGLWPGKDGKVMYIGLEYGDQVQAINMETYTAMPPIQIGQSPQALLYANNAAQPGNAEGLLALTTDKTTRTIQMENLTPTGKEKGRLAVRNIGQINLVEQQFSQLSPNSSYTLLMSAQKQRTPNDYILNAFSTDANGKFAGQSTAVIETDKNNQFLKYRYLLLVESTSNKTVLIYIAPDKP